MFRYRLRTLLLLTILGPPVLAWSWFGWLAYREHQRRNVLIMTVSPRIIISPEEEVRLTIEGPEN